jgi:hypothetical protein
MEKKVSLRERELFELSVISACLPACFANCAAPANGLNLRHRIRRLLGSEQSPLSWLSQTESIWEVSIPHTSMAWDEWAH